jgi:enoyl-CoA hydratase/carnithine racemase
MGSDEVVLYEASDGIAQLSLNRPDALNAWTPELGRRYFDLLEEADGDPEVRVTVVTGAGRGFCAGADFQHLSEVSDDPDATERDPRPQSLPRTLRKPVIAAINGPCAGLGFVMAMMCDMRFASEGTKLTTAFARRGLIAEYGLSWVLSRTVGPSKALDLLLSGRTLLAEEAHELGVVDRLCAPGEALADARTYAAELATYSSPASMAQIKRQVYEDLEQSLDSAYADAGRYMEESFERPDFREGIDSFLERREPRFGAVGAPIPTKAE